MSDDRRHFCSCGDTKCPFNPNNPANLAAHRGCDRCIQKCIALCEVPSCLFKVLGDTKGWQDYSAEGFAHFVEQHPRTEEERALTAKKALTFDAAHGGGLSTGTAGL